MMNRHSAVFVGLALCTLSGCSPTSIPTQSQPVCSWAMSPPSSPEHLCTVVFTTLRTLASADQNGNDQAIHRIVANPAIASRIIAYGRSIRAQGATHVHVVPSLTLDVTATGLVGAASFLGGSIRGGRIREPFTLYLRVRGQTAHVVAHDPGLAW